MTPVALAYARYWRNALADAELGRGAFTQKDVREFRLVDGEALAQGRIIEPLLSSLFQGDYETAQSRPVLLRPLLYRARTEHGRARANLQGLMTPIVTRATLLRNGGLTPSSDTVVPRDLLEPQDRAAFTIGTIDALDGFLTSDTGLGTEGSADVDSGGEDQPARWQAYRRLCGRLLTAVCPDLGEDGRFERADHGYLEVVDSSAGTGRHVSALYDHLQDAQPSMPLFETFAVKPATEPEPCLPEGAEFVSRLAHSSPRYALADAQRRALAHLLSSSHGDVVAVNGPPGTGKTTLLLSVVASLWAEAALKGGEPPIILAASTNNQAVTNILDAFATDFSPGDGPFAGRWLPNVGSFGSYFPASSRRIEAGAYQTQGFFDEVEDGDYLATAEAAFLRAAAVAFPDLIEPTIEQVVRTLHHRLRAQANELVVLEAAWTELVAARETVRTVLGDASVVALRAVVAEAEAEQRRIEALVERWDKHLGSEPIWHVLFAWLSSVAHQRLYRARVMLQPLWPSALPGWRSITDVTADIAHLADDACRVLTQRRNHLTQVEHALDIERTCLDRWREALGLLEADLACAEEMSLGDTDLLADTQLRFPIFLTTTHYWEGRWLLDMAAIDDPTAEKRQTGRKAMMARWRRRMKLTPCAVSTFYMLPKLMKVARREGGAFVDDYLYGAADLLIVDEAGQASPEVAGAAFALARRALVIGDTAQIEPIWNVPVPVDSGNLLALGLLTVASKKSDDNPVAESGRSAASGSVMRAAQQASRHHQDPDLARGLMLYEHRRCFDEIISYCNDLCYRGKLKPMRGPKADAFEGQGRDGLPALGYLHIDGLGEEVSGGSRRNLTEANTMAAWLVDQRGALERAYPGQSLDQVIGIVTPFVAQANAIRDALSAVGIEASPGKGPTVGTVHAFQGAQRPVILFSAAYSKHADGGFIDRDPRMLNVAVSRAMNSFLVFGDMDLFALALPSSPRGQLARRLFADEINGLAFTQSPRRDLIRRAGVDYLHDAAAHDAFLRDVLEHSTHDVHIVTPWITRRALEQSDIIPVMAAAVERGVRVAVYTDRDLNKDRLARGQARPRDLDVAFAALTDVGVTMMEIRGVHSKIVMADDALYCVGSFNWLSAARTGALARYETSMIYRGDVATEIEVAKNHLRRRTAPRRTKH